MFMYRSRRRVVIAKQFFFIEDVSHREPWSRSRKKYRPIRIHKTAKYSTRFSTPVLATPLQLETRPIPANPYVLYPQVSYFAAKAVVSPYATTSGGQNYPHVPVNRSHAQTTIPLHPDEPLDETRTAVAQRSRDGHGRPFLCPCPSVLFFG